MRGDAFCDMKKGEDSGELVRRLVAGESAVVGRRGSRAWLVCGAACVVVAAAWLLALTLLRLQDARELADARTQIRELRAAVDEVTTWADAQRALLSDINALDDGVFAELDGGRVESGRPAEGKQTGAAASAPPNAGEVSIDSITEIDDEDFYEEDGESGWYQDYDNDRQDGSAGMVRLSADDMLAGTAAARAQDDAAGSTLSQVRRLLMRERQGGAHAGENAVAGESELSDGISAEVSGGEGRQRRSVRQEAPAQDSVEHAAGYLNSWPEPEASPPEPARADSARRARFSRQQEENAPQPRRDFIAAHFHGNTSHMSTQTHPHYKGNGLVRLAHDAAHSVWWPADWTRLSPHPAAPALTRRGHLRVRHTAIYLVYVQIYYLDAHDSTGWVLHRQRGGGDGREAVLQCASTAPAPRADEPPQEKPNSCFSASVLKLRRGDALAVRNTGGDRHSLMQPEKSFIGVVKLADADDDDDGDDY